MIIEIDANSKLGEKYIPSDPHQISPNGQLLAGIIERHALFVANGSDKCEGTITRKRITKYRKEESAIDIVLFSQDMVSHFVSLKVDEEKKHVLTRITRTMKGVVTKQSDHNVLETEFNCKVMEVKEKPKCEIYNLKNKDSQAKFKEYTSKDNALSSIFDSDDNLDKLVERFIKKLDGCISMNFSKIRLKEKRKDKNQELFDKMRDLKGKTDPESQTELTKVKEAIADAANARFQIIKDEVDSLKQNESLNSNKLWRLKKKLCPNSRDPPCAMRDNKGNLLTSDNLIKELALNTYTERLKSNTIEDNLKEHELDTNKLCEARMKLVKLNKTEPWDMDDLSKAIKKLGKDKSRDAQGHANEIFKEEVAGSDLLKAVLKPMNLIKKRQTYPKIMEKCNITSLHKKGPKQDFANYRGVFRVSILRSILDTLIYNSSYETIDSNLSDGNVGCRKKRGCRDNIFVISAVMNSVVNGASPPIQVQVTDVEKCFDKMWLQSCINSLYEAGLKNDMLNLLYIENKRQVLQLKSTTHYLKGEV